MPKKIDIYEYPECVKQLKCWSRWVDARVIYRKLKDNPPDWFEWLENSLDGTHYTLTEETFNKIKERYESRKI